MIPFEFIVEGVPVSHQTKNRTALQTWKQTVRTAAEQHWPAGDSPTTDRVQITITYYHEGVPLDVDNMIKPIQDALNGLVYVDDRQITDTTGRLRDINGDFKVRYMSPVLAAGFIRGNEFVHVHIDLAPDPRRLKP